MQTRIEAQGNISQYFTGTKISLNRAEKAVSEWAMVDDYQAVLDLSCTRENMLSHYLSHYQLRACGLSFDTGLAKDLRDTLESAEVMSTMGADIPWQEDSFDRVLMTSPVPSYVRAVELFSEVHRVLKPGGKYVVSVSSLPGLTYLNSLHSNCELMMDFLKQMEAIGYTKVAYNKTRFGARCLIAHKQA